MLRYVQTIGMVTRTTGIENEVERLWSSVLLRDVVLKLKLYADYRKKSGLRPRSVYATQPITVDLDCQHLDSIDKIAYDQYCSVSLKYYRLHEGDSTIGVKGILLCDDKPVGAFRRKLTALPDTINTPFGALTFTLNPNGEPMEAGQEWMVSIVPPRAVALRYMNRLDVDITAEARDDLRWVIRYLLKMTSIAKLTLREPDIRRGMDFLRQLALSYNQQADAEKTEIAMRNEAFINEHIARLGAELGMTDSSVVDAKQRERVTSLADAANAVTTSNAIASKLVETESQQMILGYLSEYVANPANRYAIIPSSVGLKDKASLHLISQYNGLVQTRNKLLMVATEEAPQVKQVTATIDEIHSAIITALQQAREVGSIAQKGVGEEYADVRRRVEAVPTVERILMEEGRLQKVKGRLFKLLLQKREENSIALSSTANHGRLIDEPLVEGRVRPNVWMAHGIALCVGIVVPYSVLLLLGLLRYQIADRKELETLTERPVIAEVPTVSDNGKDSAGIVLRSIDNDRVLESFRQLRTNINFMLKEGEQTILFTSSMSGEGKTFCAANLAASIALMDKEVILCGMDIRKPALGAIFRTADRERGLSQLLQKAHITEEDVCRQIQPSHFDDNFDLLLSGPVPPNPAEMLTRDCFGQVMTILKRRYDYVVLDTAPVGLVTDTLHIGLYADMTIYVCRIGYTPHYAVGQLNGLAEEGKLPNTAFVLNGC